MIIYYDHNCGKLIYRVSINGQPEEYFSMERAFSAMQSARIKALEALLAIRTTSIIDGRVIH